LGLSVVNVKCIGKELGKEIYIGEVKGIEVWGKSSEMQ